MNIGIDIDDTITKTAECLLPYVSEYFSLELDYLIKNNYNYNNLPEECRDKYLDFGLSTFERVLVQAEIKDNAKKVIDKLREDGNKIIIVTARTNLFYKDAYDYSSKQLEKLGIKYDKLICSSDKRTVCNEEKIDLFIDDLVSNLDSINDIVNDVLLFNTNVNSISNCSYKRVNSWDEVYDYYLEKSNS